ncbi:MAG TPA: Nif3-like dinuclear metal center hexameric protein [Pirellulales bacterium]|nr:Nif3-like dinuclear metal center hexameric protein [Pirellulales bacterium]
MLAEISAFLESIAPAGLAEDWDNVGLLVGSRDHAVRRVMTCLTITQPVVQEAVREQADLIVSHHPLPFRPLKRITDASPEGRLLWELIGARIAVYSSHTAFDSARDGINQRLAEGLLLTNVAPLVPCPAAVELGTGRWGIYWEAITVAELAQLAKTFLKIDQLQVVGDLDRPLKRVAVACGSAGELLSAARDAECEAFVTGETRFHTCLEAEASDLALVLVGHYASERFGVERLAEVLAAQFPPLTVWASRAERDPFRFV